MRVCKLARMYVHSSIDKYLDLEHIHMLISVFYSHDLHLAGLFQYCIILYRVN